MSKPFEKESTLIWLFIAGTILGALVVGLVFTNRMHDMEAATVRVTRPAPSYRVPTPAVRTPARPAPAVRQSAPAASNGPASNGGYAPQGIGPTTGY